MISYLLNPNSVNCGQNNFYISEAGEVAANTKITIFENTKPTVLEYLEFATNYTSSKLIIQYYDGTTYQSIGLVKVDGSGTDGVTPTSLAANGCNLFEVNAHSTSNNIYKFSLAKPLHFSQGVRIQLENTAQSTPKNLACRAWGHEL